jgi:hypothetical protein
MRFTSPVIAAAAAIALTGCMPSAITPAQVTQQMKTADWSGAKVSNVSCKPGDSRHHFVCTADYRATRQSTAAAARKAVVDTSKWTPAEWNKRVAAQSGRIRFEVTADSNGGKITAYKRLGPLNDKTAP